MHHRPAGLPLSARVSGALRRSVRPRGAARGRAGRLALGMALSTAVTGVVLAVPVVSTGAGTSPMSLDSSSSSATRLAEESSPVVMGRDGAATAPAPSDVAPPATEVPETQVTDDTATGASAEVPGTTSSAPETATGAPADPLPSTSASTTAPTSASRPAATPRTSAATSASTPTTTGSTKAASEGVPAPDLEDEVLVLVNAARDDAGCAPLVADQGLAAVARAHSADMRDRDFFDHVNPDRLDPFDRARAAGQTNARAENIAHGQPTPEAVVAAWMDDRGDRANILDCDLRTVGVGFARGAGGPWWTQLFGI